MLSTETNVWRSLGKGSVITLTDEETLNDLIGDPGNLSSGIDLMVEKVVEFKNDNCTWLLFETDHDILNLVVKLVDDDIDIKVVFQPDWAVHGSRQDVIDGDCHWLFKEPRDIENFRPCDLDYADSIARRYDDLGLVKFNAKLPTVFFTNSREFKQLREWTADYKEMQNPDLIVFEIGGVDREGESIEIGGWVEFYQGTSVTPGDVSLLPV